jgi:hypothetical protein
VQYSQSFCLVDVRLPGFLGQKFPTPAKLFGDLSIVLVRSDFSDLPALQLRPDHERVHGSFDVVQLVFFGLKGKKKKFLKNFFLKNIFSQSVALSTYLFDF